MKRHFKRWITPTLLVATIAGGTYYFTQKGETRTENITREYTVDTEVGVSHAVESGEFEETPFMDQQYVIMSNGNKFIFEEDEGDNLIKKVIALEPGDTYKLHFTTSPQFTHPIYQGIPITLRLGSKSLEVPGINNE